MKGKSRDQVAETIVDCSGEWLKEHSLVLHQQHFDGHGIVTIGRPDGSYHHRVSFVLMPMGYLVMTGDHDTVCWGIYSGKTVAGAIAWMTRKSPLDGYFCEKMRIGMGSKAPTSEWDEEVAVFDAIRYRKEAKGEDREQEAEKWADILRKLAENAEGLGYRMWSETELIEEVLAIDDDAWEWAGNFGQAPSTTRLWAWALVRKVYELLKVNGVYDESEDTG